MTPRRVFTAAANAVGRLGMKVAGGAGTARIAEWTAARLRYAAGVLDGVAYRARGHRPDPDVDDDVLADRVRTALGPVLKQHDLPRVNVMVERHVVLLHGEVGEAAEAEAVMAAARAVPGVRDVRSHLHVGLHPGTTRPSEGRQAQVRSQALIHLEAAAEDVDLAPALVAPTTMAILAALLDRLPEGERQHVRVHLPADVLEGVDRAPVRKRAAEVRTLAEYLDTVTGAVPGLGTKPAEEAAVAVLGALRSQVPEEERDVAAVLPHELRDLWERAGAVRSRG